MFLVVFLGLGWFLSLVKNAFVLVLILCALYGFWKSFSFFLEAKEKDRQKTAELKEKLEETLASLEKQKEEQIKKEVEEQLKDVKRQLKNKRWTNKQIKAREGWIRRELEKQTRKKLEEYISESS